MGWLFTNKKRRELITELTQDWNRTVPEKDYTVWVKALAYCFRGGVYKGVLWIVWEHRYVYTNGHIKTRRWIECDILEYSRRDGGWGYKNMDESMRPCYYSCPLKYLDMTPEINAEWRTEVKKWHEQQSAKRKQRTMA